MNNLLGYYAVSACVALGATVLYAVTLILAAVLVRETRDFYQRLTHGSDRQNPRNPES